MQAPSRNTKYITSFPCASFSPDEPRRTPVGRVQPPSLKTVTSRVNIYELCQALLEKWDVISRESRMKQVTSMIRGCQFVSRQNGEYMQYLTEVVEFFVMSLDVFQQIMELDAKV